MEIKEKKRLAHCLPYSRYENPIVIFVTVCVQNRRPVLANDRVHHLLVETWRKLTDWRVGFYMIMPDHLHFLCSENVNGYASLDRWMKAWKKMSARQIGTFGCDRLWQNDYWDTQIRSGRHLQEQLEYMRNNPVNSGCCNVDEIWPYRGEVFDTHAPIDFTR